MRPLLTCKRCSDLLSQEGNEHQQSRALKHINDAVGADD